MPKEQRSFEQHLVPEEKVDRAEIAAGRILGNHTVEGQRWENLAHLYRGIAVVAVVAAVAAFAAVAVVAAVVPVGRVVNTKAAGQGGQEVLERQGPTQKDWKKAEMARIKLQLVGSVAAL